MVEKLLRSSEKALEPYERDPKFKKNLEDKRIEELRRKVEKLEDLLKEKDEEMKRLRERLNPDKKDFKPARCPYCGFEKVYKSLTIKR